MSLLPLAFAFSSLIFFAAAPGQSAHSSPGQPTIGIDMTFSDRFHEAIEALRLKHYSEAIAKVNVALAMQPDDKNAAILHAMRGDAFWELRDVDRALADYNEAIRRDPAMRRIRGRRGILNCKKGNYAAAIPDLTIGLGETRDPGYLYHARATAFLKEGKRELARQDFERVTQAPVRGAVGYADRGDAFEKLGDAEHAARDLATARRMDPSNEGVLNRMAWQEATSSRAELRDGKRAVRDATRACRASKWKDPNIVDTLAAAYAEEGDFGHALNFEHQAITLQIDVAARKVLQKHLALFKAGKPVREDSTIQ